MNKKSFFINATLLLFFIVLCILIYMGYNRDVKRRQDEAAANIKLKNVGYSSVSPIGYKNASGVIEAFLGAYNEADGEKLAAMMDLIARYIYEDAGEENFDSKYEEIMINPEGYDNLILMTQSAKSYEQEIIETTKSYKVKMTLIENSEIENTGKYLGKMTAKIHVIDESSKIDEDMNLQLLLLNRDNTYYVIDFWPIDENGNKIGG